MLKILVVDDDADLRLTVSSALADNHYQVEQAQDGEEAVNRVRAGKYDLVLMDVNMPKMNGLEALKEMKAHDPALIVIILTAFSNVKGAIEATREGAYNYLEKPIKEENLVYIVNQALKTRQMVNTLSYSAPAFKLPNGTEFIGESNEMKKIFTIIDKLARVDTAVLIRGESGTGKELVASSLHFSGPRKDNRFVTLNCSAIPETLIESEFFGHEKGAFTGADSRKIGKFQYADGGTLFLDEIGDISPAMQVKLLRVLQEKRFTPIGSNREIEVNVRIVAATHRNLEEMIKQGKFREDLFYRLNVLPIQLPPLRERKKDLQALTKYFVDNFNQKHGKQIKGLAPETQALLVSHDWPGNIRELENVIEHAFVIETENEIYPESLPEHLLTKLKPQSAELLQNEEDDDDFAFMVEENEGEESISASSPKITTSFTLDIAQLDFQANKEAFERQFLVSALKAFKGKINQTALHANIPKKTLIRKLQKYGISAKEFN
jgi:DNA-binding NtrC family response regulator